MDMTWKNFENWKSKGSPAGSFQLGKKSMIEKFHQIVLIFHV
jgi:hypothetical protein